MTPPFIFSAPRDARTPVVERLEWLTDVQISANGTERRTARRAFPRHYYSFDLYLAHPAARECLNAIRTESRVLLPLWPHVFERPARSPSAGIEAEFPQVLLLDHAGAARQTAAPIAWRSGYGIAAPAAFARFANDQRGFSHATRRLALGNAAFRLEGFQEVVEPYTGPASSVRPSLPLLDVFTPAGSSLAEQIDVDANAFDPGVLDLYEVRYMKRRYTLGIVLNTREQIVAFRQLLFSLRGSLNPLRWTAPGDAEEKTWRLSTDAVELAYSRPGLASCSLSLTEISE